MSAGEVWDEPSPPGLLTSMSEPLNQGQRDTLWAMFAAIATHWNLDWNVELARSRWLDMVEARESEEPSYRGEYANAAAVYEALVGALGEPAAIERLYQATIVTKPEQATTRLTHAKFYVANDFLRCFVVTGGFRGFVPEARNYTGFMGGSRFREWPPVRTGAKL